MNFDNAHNIYIILATILGGGVAVHLVANLLKRVFKLKSSTAIHTMVVALGVVAAAAQYIIQIHESLPPVILGVSTSAIYGISQVIYNYRNYASNFLNQVKAYNDSVTTPMTLSSNPTYLNALPSNSTSTTTLTSPTPQQAPIPSEANF